VVNDQADERADQQGGEDRVGQRAADQPVDLIEPVAQDADAHGDRQRGQADRERDIADESRSAAGSRVDREADDQGAGAGAQALQLLAPLAVGTTVAEQLVAHRGQYEHNARRQANALDGAKPGRGAAGVAEADQIAVGVQRPAQAEGCNRDRQRAGDEHDAEREIGSQRPTPARAKPAVGEQRMTSGSSRIAYSQAPLSRIAT
jgi:hypothetical protein